MTSSTKTRWEPTILATLSLLWLVPLPRIMARVPGSPWMIFWEISLFCLQVPRSFILFFMKLNISKLTLLREIQATYLKSEIIEVNICTKLKHRKSFNYKTQLRVGMIPCSRHGIRVGCWVGLSPCRLAPTALLEPQAMTLVPELYFPSSLISRSCQPFPKPWESSHRAV